MSVGGRAAVEARRLEIAKLLNSEWIAAGNIRTWHAIYYLEELDEWRSAILFQRRGVPQFEIGVVRDVSSGGAEQLKAAVMTTYEAVIFLGLHLVEEPPRWEHVL